MGSKTILHECLSSGSVRARSLHSERALENVLEWGWEGGRSKNGEVEGASTRSVLLLFIFEYE